MDRLEDVFKGVEEILIELIVPVVAMFLSFYEFMNDYMEMKEVKTLILFTIGLFIIIEFIYLSRNNKKRQKTILKFFLISAIIFALYFWYFYNVMLDLHKNFGEFFKNYIKYIIFNIFIIFFIKYAFSRCKTSVKN